jgi:hypothetical protein
MVLGERLQVLRQNAFAAERRVTHRQTRLSELIYKIEPSLNPVQVD